MCSSCVKIGSLQAALQQRHLHLATLDLAQSRPCRFLLNVTGTGRDPAKIVCMLHSMNWLPTQAEREFIARASAAATEHRCAVYTLRLVKTGNYTSARSQSASLSAVLSLFPVQVSGKAESEGLSMA